MTKDNEKTNNIVAIDVGVKHAIVAAKSNGKTKDKYTTHDTPKDCKRQPDDYITKLQRHRDRCKKGSREWTKRHYKLKLELEKIKNKKTDHERKTIKKIVTGSDVVCIEDLKVKNMIKPDRKNTGLNREIHYAGMSHIMLWFINIAYNEGKLLLKTQPHYTSITCCKCGNVNILSRITRDIFKCTKCRFKLDADYNAGSNIKMFCMPSIRKFYRPNFKKSKNKKLNNANSNKTVRNGGRDCPRKTREPMDGLNCSVPRKNNNNQVMEGLSDCQKKVLSE